MTRTRAGLRRRAALLALVGAGCGACGYTVGYADYGPDGRTVALRVVANDTFRQRFELPLTRSLQEQLPIHANLVVVGPDRADTVLDVELVDVRNRSMAGQARGTPVREGALEFAVRARLRDARTGEVLRDARVVDRAEFRIAVGETEASALDEAAYDLARKIVLSLEGPI
ncbi:MAG: hypothetical protein IPM29_03450 [Planctomycetes bacterium]|nr:hypothetical protein [Planctomycetota bacterium]